MPKSSLLDFKAIKGAMTMEQLLQHYGLLDGFTRSGDSLSGPCPIHKGSNPTQFRVSISKNIWNCFSDCKRGGNALDFISLLEGSTIHAAALKAIEWFNLDPEAVRVQTGSPETPRPSGPGIDGEAKAPAAAITKTVSPPPDASAPNPPLKFRLEKLDSTHPYLSERGLIPETVSEFGIGYCSKGLMQGRIAIPIQNVNGDVVAYVGRFAGNPEEGVPKYKLPPGFRKSLELFNLHRVLREPTGTPLVIVEGFFDCIRLFQLGHRKVVALMGSSMSTAQESLLREHFPPNTRMIVMLDEDEAGRAVRDDIATRLARFAYVRIHVFAEEGRQPEHLTPEEVTTLLG